MDPYRDEMRRVEKEARWTLTKFLPVALIVIALIAAIAVGLSWGLKAGGIIGKNIEREVTQHTQQYTEAKASLLQGLYNDWLGLDTEITELSRNPQNESVVAAKRAQQKALVEQMRSEADLIPESEVPRSVARFLAQRSSP